MIGIMNLLVHEDLHPNILEKLESSAMSSLKDKLWDVCVKFINDQRIYCTESTIEDRVYENAPELVADIADIVGYYEDPEEEDDD